MTARAGAAKRGHNSMLYWYPKIVDRVPTPKTAAVLLPSLLGGSQRGYASWIDEGIPKDFMAEVHKGIKSLALTYPIFIRTDQMAAKHSWARTCYVEKDAHLSGHIRNLIEENVMMDMVGDLLPKAIFIREFLTLKTYFTTYELMPVAKEFRFFAKAGKVDCYHPYWPHEALEQGHPSKANWRDDIHHLELDGDIESMRALVEKASKPFKEQMSVDICQDQLDKWWVTDMALGKDSYHWQHGTKDGGRREGEP